MQKGFREFLLCGRCEGDVGRLETYSARVLREVLDLSDQQCDTVTIEVDPLRFRLFGLSLLWRSAVSRLHMFRQVHLGPLEENLRRMLVDGEPGEPHEFGFSLVRIDWDPPVEGEIMEAPRRCKWGGLHAYRFLAAGFLWVFVASKESDRLRGRFPFVGLNSQLTIPRHRASRRSLFSAITRILSRHPLNQREWLRKYSERAE